MMDAQLLFALPFSFLFGNRSAATATALLFHPTVSSYSLALESARVMLLRSPAVCNSAI